MKLYSFFRSGTSHRLRIALHLKGLTPDYVPVDLRVDEQAQALFKAINPQGLVPALELDNGQVLIQSPAIIEWLEERYPTPALLPADPLARAQVRALAAIVGCDVHPSTTAASCKRCASSLARTKPPSTPGAPPGSPPGLTPSKPCWPRTPRAAATAMAARPAWPMCT